MSEGSTISLGLAFGAGVVALVAITLFLITLIGRIANGHMWVGALLVGLLELGLGAWMIKRGITTLAEPSYTLEQSRAALKDTANWASNAARV